MKKNIIVTILIAFLISTCCYSKSDTSTFKKKNHFEFSAFPSLYINNFTIGYAWRSKPKIENVIYGNLFFSLLLPIYSSRIIYQQNRYFKSYKNTSFYVPFWAGLRSGAVAPVEEGNGSNFLISSFGSGIGATVKYRSKEKWKFEFDAGGAFGLMSKNYVKGNPISKIKEYNKPFMYPSVRLKMFWILNL